MKISSPDFYFGKKIKVHFADGDIVTGEFSGYSYDYDDDGKEFLELDVERKDGVSISFTEDEIEKIEIVNRRKNN